MTAIPLITSLPPVFSRQNPDGAEIGPDWLETCVTSWLRAGFRPITVNSAREDMPEFALLPEFDQVKTQRDGFDAFGKRYVPLWDMLARATEGVDGPVGIVNSDIALELDQDAKDRIATLRPGACIVCNRIDVADTTMTGGAVYGSGFDFFVFHASDLRAMPENGMYFGLPWWDHFLPVSILGRGAQRLSGEGIDAYHLSHGGRWKRRLWRSLGHRFIEDIRAQGDAIDAAYLSALGQIVGRRAARRARFLPGGLRKDDFYALSDLNIDYVDRALP
ncbi:hypothetical protein [Roseovarius spongiae]|nr:hypothetical protein [Roseovarius spongiae]